MTLVEFLTARLDEDEAATRSGDLDPHYVTSQTPTLMDHGNMFVPSVRWLADVDAKRRIVGWCAPREHVAPGTKASSATASFVLRCLASVYADHPQYDEAWRV